MVLWIGWSLFSLCGKTKINILLMHKVLDEDTIKTWNIAPSCLWQNVGMFQKATWRKLFHAFSTSWKPGCQWQITSAFPWCHLGWSWATCPTAARVGCCKRTSFRCRCPLARACNIIIFVRFSVENLTLWVPFYLPIAHLAAKNRFSRRFVLMQKGVSMWMQWNEYLFKEVAICTNFRAIYSTI